ncbi:pirin family protein [Nevskia soli]|uniref:pirin family protein n=1 Tax=Nevskia soli TaxID=418856 RepID=UPI00068CA5A4|nr:pirin family protein [Nevskia soli]
MSAAARVLNDAAATPRAIVFRTRGSSHGPITRLVSPSDVGELIKPFVFLDAFAAMPGNGPQFGWHPHSGIATLTVLLEGEVGYEETTGVKGMLNAGGVEWMRAAAGVWHTGTMNGRERVKGFQLWVALPPELENGEPQSRYLSNEEVPVDGPARVVLGRSGDAVSAIPAPAGMNYLDVRLKAGERWRYQPPQGHTVAWVAVHEGALNTPHAVPAGELAVFDRSAASIEFEAQGDTGFVLGSAVPHPHELVLGYYSVHTSRAALDRGEREIDRIGQLLHADGRLR